MSNSQYKPPHASRICTLPIRQPRRPGTIENQRACGGQQSGSGRRLCMLWGWLLGLGRSGGSRFASSHPNPNNTTLKAYRLRFSQISSPKTLPAVSNVETAYNYIFCGCGSNTSSRFACVYTWLLPFSIWVDKLPITNKRVMQLRKLAW